MQSLERGKLNFCNNLTDLFSNCFDFLSLTFEFDYQSRLFQLFKDLIEHFARLFIAALFTHITPCYIVTWLSSRWKVLLDGWLARPQEVSPHSTVSDLTSPHPTLWSHTTCRSDCCWFVTPVTPLSGLGSWGRVTSWFLLLAGILCGVKSVHYNQLALEPWVILQDRLLCWGELAVLLRKMIIYFVDLDYPLYSHPPPRCEIF